MRKMRVLIKSWDNRQRSTPKTPYKTWTRRARWFDSSPTNIRVNYEDDTGSVNVIYGGNEKSAEEEFLAFKGGKTVQQIRESHRQL